MTLWDICIYVYIVYVLTSPSPSIYVYCMHYILYVNIGNSKSTLTHYSGDYATFVNTVAEQKIAQARLKVAYEKEKEKLREFISREGKKYDNPAHQAQVTWVLLCSLWRKYGCYCIFHS